MIEEKEYIIENPSTELLEFMEKMKQHKKSIREEMRNVEPLFTINVDD